MLRRTWRSYWLSAILLTPTAAGAQTPAAQHQHDPAMAPGWRVMQDGAFHALFNRQSGPRGGDEFVAPNWWMGMASRARGRHQFTVQAMLSLDRVTVGRTGYGELFQRGESLDGEPILDRQHPHDAFSQLAGSWRIAFGERTALTLAGGPAGDPTLGPVAYMHRPSAAGIPFAPLGHHTFDATHVSFGVVAAALDRGRWTVEGSLFNGREPDDNRWDLDLGRLDSVAGRVWLRPSDQWELQLSTGRLRDPEPDEPGDVWRTTTSASWTAIDGDEFTAVTIGAGLNASDRGRQGAFFVEATRERRRATIFGRIEVVEIDPDAWSAVHAAVTEPSATLATLAAITVGAGWNVLRWRGWHGTLSGEVTGHGVPAELRSTHGSHPYSVQFFFRLRVPSGLMGRMWGMRLTQPMRHSMR